MCLYRSHPRKLDMLCKFIIRIFSYNQGWSIRYFFKTIIDNTQENWSGCSLFSLIVTETRWYNFYDIWVWGESRKGEQRQRGGRGQQAEKFNWQLKTKTERERGEEGNGYSLHYVRAFMYTKQVYRFMQMFIMAGVVVALKNKRVQLVDTY